MDLLKAVDCLGIFSIQQVACSPLDEGKMVEIMGGKEEGYELVRVLWMLRDVNEDNGC